MMKSVLLGCIAGAAVAIPEDYPGYFHFKNMNFAREQGARSTQHKYVAPHPKTSNVIFNTCDKMGTKCQYFNGVNMGFFHTDSSHDTYIRHTAGPIVKPGENEYIHVHAKFVDESCDMINGPFSGNVDEVHVACDKDPECDGFVVANDYSGGFICKFHSNQPLDTYLKLKNR